MNKNIITIIILAVLLVVSIAYIAYNQTYERAYQRGLNDGQALIIQNIQQTGNIPVVTNQNNQTQVTWIPIQQICGGGG